MLRAKTYIHYMRDEIKFNKINAINAFLSLRGIFLYLGIPEQCRAGIVEKIMMFKKSRLESQAAFCWLISKIHSD
ncbi:hypothetical protein BIT28_14530 [Photobacterium proteolyticum]|uniref:Uncharacterized protein n=1 Tax=Photobacterium proteolyticum TaxID=1903952 RepID=A0A1Q9GV70_9GAMM|nr:hypothetical protein BIT28_14530 [Photobacterium proteolyticum]